MQLKSLKLINIRSYLNENITFPDGSLLLSGDIGAGKSTILQAIEFALFGSRRKHLSGESLLRNGKKEGSVELSLDIGEKHIIIKRTLKRARTDVKQLAGYIIIDNKKTELMPSELKARVLDLLGYPKTLLTKTKDLIFRYTVYTPQEEMKQILTDDEESRLDTLRKVFGIDKYKRIKENCAIFSRDLKEKTRIMEARVGDLEEKKRQKKEREHEISELDIKLDNLRPRYQAIKNEEKEQKAILLKHEKHIKQLHELQKEMSALDAQLREKVSRIKAIHDQIEHVSKDIEKLTKKRDTFKVTRSAKEIEKELSESEHKINEALRKREVLDEKLSNMSLRKKALDAEIKDKIEQSSQLIVKENKARLLSDDISSFDSIDSDLLKAEEKLAKLERLMYENEHMIEEATKLTKDITSLDKCPLCLQDVTVEHKKDITRKKAKELEVHKNLLAKYGKEKERQRLQVKDLKDKRIILQKKEKDLAILKTEITSMRKETHDLKQKKVEQQNIAKEEAHVREERDKYKDFDMTKENAIIEKKRKELEDARSSEDLTRSITEKKALVEDLEKESKMVKKDVGKINATKMEHKKEIAILISSEESYDKERKKYDTIIGDMRKIEIKLTELRKEKEGIEKLKEALAKDIVEKEKLYKEMQRKGQLHHWITASVIPVMDLIERQVMLKVYQEFNELFKTWFNILIEDEAINVRLDENFSPVIEQNGYETTIDNLSGGEKTSCALAYRLSLNKVINDFIGMMKTDDLIILDEPTDGFSSEQLDKVRVILEELAIRQVIIVSHESKIESFVDNVIRIAKSEHISRAIVG